MHQQQINYKENIWNRKSLRRNKWKKNIQKKNIKKVINKEKTNGIGIYGKKNTKKF